MNLEVATVNIYNPEHHNVKREDKCEYGKEINRTITTTPPVYRRSIDNKVHKLQAQLDQLTNIESRVYSLMARLDLLTNL